jgi:CheY-like chemotaxis protein
LRASLVPIGTEKGLATEAAEEKICRLGENFTEWPFRPRIQPKASYFCQTPPVRLFGRKVWFHPVSPTRFWFIVLAMGQLASNYVLLCEDDDNDVFLFEHAWRQAGIQLPVRVMADGLKVLKLLEVCVQTGKDCPGLIISDHRLMVRGGMDILEYVHNSPLFCSIPVVLTSGVVDPQEKSKALQLGAIEYLQKPLTAEMIRGFMTKISSAPRFC